MPETSKEESKQLQDENEKGIEEMREQLKKDAEENRHSRVTVEADPPLESYSFEEQAKLVRDDAGAAGDNNPATFAYQQAHGDEVNKSLELERAIYGNSGAATMPRQNKDSANVSPLNAPVTKNDPPPNLSQPPALGEAPTAPRRGR